MAADDATFKHLKRIDWFDARSHKVSGVSARTESAVPIVDQRQNIFRVPKSVARVIGPFGMIVDGEHDVIFLYEFLDQIHRFGLWLRRDRAQPELLRKLEYLSAFRFIIGQADDAVI